MRPRIRYLELLGILALMPACGSGPTSPNPTGLKTSLPLFPRPMRKFVGAPVSGNGGKLVIPLDFGFPVSCGAETIDFNLTGWVQIRTFDQPNNRNVELDVFHGVLTYTNSAGQTFVWHDVGPDHYYLDRNGDLILTISGRATASGNLDRTEIVIGHVRINLTTQQVEFVAGNQRGRIDDLACAALT